MYQVAVAFYTNVRFGSIACVISVPIFFTHCQDPLLPKSYIMLQNRLIYMAVWSSGKIPALGRSQI